MTNISENPIKTINSICLETLDAVKSLPQFGSSGSFETIKQFMHQVRMSFNGKFGFNGDLNGYQISMETEKGTFLNAGKNIAYVICEAIGLSKRGKWIDLGSGMGDWAFVAATFNKNGVLAEYNSLLFGISKALAKKISKIVPQVAHLKFIKCDYLNQDFGEYEVLYNYVNTNTELLLEGKFAREAKKGALLVFFDPKRRGLSGRFSQYYKRIELRSPDYDLLGLSGVYVYARNDKKFDQKEQALLR